VRVQVTSASRRPEGLDSRLSYGFVAEPGRFETTLTRPDLFAYYIRQQLRLLLHNQSQQSYHHQQAQVFRLFELWFQCL
jgi:hypothetical protein